MPTAADGLVPRPSEWPSCSPAARSSSIPSAFGWRAGGPAAHRRLAIAHVGRPHRHSPERSASSARLPCGIGCPTIDHHDRSDTGPTARRWACGRRVRAVEAPWQEPSRAARRSTSARAPTSPRRETRGEVADRRAWPRATVGRFSRLAGILAGGGSNPPALQAPITHRPGLPTRRIRYRPTSMARSIWSGTISFGQIDNFPHQNH
jgi:hypothetical protein